MQSLLSVTRIRFLKFAASMELDCQWMTRFSRQLNRWQTSCGVELHVGQMLGLLLDMYSCLEFGSILVIVEKVCCYCLVRLFSDSEKRGG